jgi:hypothetical protein
MASSTYCSKNVPGSPGALAETDTGVEPSQKDYNR